MSSFIDELLDYYETGLASGSIQTARELLDKYKLRVIAIKLLGWMKDASRRRKAKPLKLNKNHDWCQNLLVLHKAIPELAEAFQVEPTGLNWSFSISPQQRLGMINTVNERYRPTVREAWDEEIQDRLQELRAGRVRGGAWAEARDQILA